MSLPVTRPCGRALLVGNPASRAHPLALLNSLGYACDEADDPYSGLLQICRQSQAFAAIVLSLTSLYREELPVIRTLKQRFPQMDIWLAQTDGRHAAMAEAIRMGADGLLSEDGLHRLALPPAEPSPSSIAAKNLASVRESIEPADPEKKSEESTGGNGAEIGSESHEETRDGQPTGVAIGEPVLSAEELRALLQEYPFVPPRAEEI